MEQPHRKQVRLPGYDYSSPGACFVTICTENRRCILSRIAVGEGLAPPGATLTSIGAYVDAQIQGIPDRFSSVTIDRYGIVPNHIHLIVSLHEGAGGASPSPTLYDVVRAIKSIRTRFSRPYLGAEPLWQRSYYEHVIRGEDDYRQIWDYIDTNPAKWAEDRYYAE